MFLKAVWIVLLKELLCFVRDKNILIYSVLLPIFLYPTTFWIMNEITTFQRGWVENRVSRVALVHAELAPELREVLDNSAVIEIVPGNFQVPEKKCDAIVEVDESYRGPEGPCYALKIRYDSTDEYSSLARNRILEEMEIFQNLLMSGLASDRHLPQNIVRTYDIETYNIASGERMGAFIIGRIMPMMIIIMAAMGTLYPAIDVIVGERERKTLETTLLVPCSRFSIVLGKFSSVVLAGMVAVFLNIASLGLTAGHTLFMLEKEGDAIFTIPARAFPLIIVTTLIIAAGFGAICILIASYARNFREGQSLVTPFFVISFQPAIIAALPGITMTTPLALIPVANAAILFRDIINDLYQWEKIVLVLFSLIFYTSCILFFAARRLNNENTFWREAPELTKKTGWKNKLFKLGRK